MRLLIALFCILSLPICVADNTTHFRSGEQQVHLLELYTSEGCSSCPPAEAWLGNLLEHPDLWSRVVPVAFHVDYWNYLGWKDPFSSPQHSQRQRQYRAQGGVKAVYTPGFILGGEEWRSWFWSRNLKLPAEQAGNLSVSLDGKHLSARYQQRNEDDQWLELHVALLGFDLTTQVPAGENRGRTLTHQFVVLDLVSHLSSTGRWVFDWPESTRPGKTALAAWVTYPDRLQPLQATGGWLKQTP